VEERGYGGFLPIEFMPNDQPASAVVQRLAEVRALCPEMRLGQFLSTVGLLAEDETGHSLWDVEDAELAEALERFAKDLERRSPIEAPAQR
jgi:hypothetical protein